MVIMINITIYYDQLIIINIMIIYDQDYYYYHLWYDHHYAYI